FAIVADSEFLEIVHMLYAKAEVLHPMTVSQDVQEIFGIAQKHLADHLQMHLGQLHLCVDGWTAPNVISFLGVTV
ncbi:uncharacterized protein PHACADRAFT_100575, partial [Phanerochaete carnosa HHB-10118-sp]